MLEVKEDWSKKQICELFYTLKGHGLNVFAQTKHIDEQVFKDKDVMKTYLSIKSLDNSLYLTLAMKNALPSYSLDDLIDFIKINKEVYKVLPQEMKSNWELVAAYFESSKELSDHIPADLTDMIKSMGKNFNECMEGVRKCAFSENLNRQLGESKKTTTRKMKI